MVVQASIMLEKRTEVVEAATPTRLGRPERMPSSRKSEPNRPSQIPDHLLRPADNASHDDFGPANAPLVAEGGLPAAPGEGGGS